MDQIIVLGDRKIKAKGTWQDLAPELGKLYPTADGDIRQGTSHARSDHTDEAALDRVRLMEQAASNLIKPSSRDGVYRRSSIGLSSAKCSLRKDTI